MRGLRRWPAACAAAAVFVAAGAMLTATHREPRRPLAPRAAIADALHNRQVRRGLAGTHWTLAQASGIDGRNERVSFYAGSRMVVDTLVRADGTVRAVGTFTTGGVPYGDWIAYEPSVLAALSALFILMVGVVPLRRLRNLDAVAALSLLAPVILLEHWYVSASAISAAPGICYLTARCIRRAFGAGEAVAPSVALYDHLTRRWSGAERVRTLRIIVIAIALVFVMVGVSSPAADDVAYAVMEGATRIIHGVLPYGHLPGDVFHGDTYPILSYALYVPLAAVEPVRATWSSLDGELALTVLAALLTAGLLAWSAGRGSRRPATPAELAGRRAAAHSELAGLRAAIALLAFPPLLITASSGTTDPALGAMLLLALLLWRRPAVCAGMLAVAGWFKLAPFALVPVWLAPRRGRSLLLALVAIAAVSVACVAVVAGLGGLDGVPAMVRAIGYQFDRSSPQSAWYALGITGLQPLGEAAVLALVAGGSVRLWRAPDLAADRGRLAALSAAVMLGLQFTSNQWAFMYLAWVMPLLGVSLLSSEAVCPAVERAWTSCARPSTPVWTP